MIVHGRIFDFVKVVALALTVMLASAISPAFADDALDPRAVAEAVRRMQISPEDGGMLRCMAVTTQMRVRGTSVRSTGWCPRT